MAQIEADQIEALFASTRKLVDEICDQHRDKAEYELGRGVMLFGLVVLESLVTDVNRIAVSLEIIAMKMDRIT